MGKGGGVEATRKELESVLTREKLTSEAISFRARAVAFNRQAGAYDAAA